MARPEVSGDTSFAELIAEYQSPLLRSRFQELSRSYSSWRRIRGDGHCFYRSFLAGLLDHIIKNKDEGLVNRLVEQIDLYSSAMPAPYLQAPALDTLKAVLQRTRPHMGSARVDYVREVFRSEASDQRLVKALRAIAAYFIMHNATTPVSSIMADAFGIEKHRDMADLTFEQMAATSNLPIDKFCLEVLDSAEDAHTATQYALPCALRVRLRLVMVPREEQSRIQRIDVPPHFAECPHVHVLLRPGHYDMLCPDPTASHALPEPPELPAPAAAPRPAAGAAGDADDTLIPDLVANFWRAHGNPLSKLSEPRVAPVPTAALHAIPGTPDLSELEACEVDGLKRQLVGVRSTCQRAAGGNAQAALVLEVAHLQEMLLRNVAQAHVQARQQASEAVRKATEQRAGHRERELTASLEQLEEDKQQLQLAIKRHQGTNQALQDELQEQRANVAQLQAEVRQQRLTIQQHEEAHFRKDATIRQREEEIRQLGQRTTPRAADGEAHSPHVQSLQDRLIEAKDQLLAAREQVWEEKAKAAAAETRAQEQVAAAERRAQEQVAAAERDAQRAQAEMEGLRKTLMSKVQELNNMKKFTAPASPASMGASCRATSTSSAAAAVAPAAMTPVASASPTHAAPHASYAEQDMLRQLRQLRQLDGASVQAKCSNLSKPEHISAAVDKLSEMHAACWKGCDDESMHLGVASELRVLRTQYVQATADSASIAEELQGVNEELEAVKQVLHSAARGTLAPLAGGPLTGVPDREAVRVVAALNDIEAAAEHAARSARPAFTECVALASSIVHQRAQLVRLACSELTSCKRSAARPPVHLRGADTEDHADDMDVDGGGGGDGGSAEWA